MPYHLIMQCLGQPSKPRQRSVTQFREVITTSVEREKQKSHLTKKSPSNFEVPLPEKATSEFSKPHKLAKSLAFLRAFPSHNPTLGKVNPQSPYFTKI